MGKAAGGNDRYAHLTDAQRRAIQTADRSILVSAAAGSGKTTVLAERCAALVCDVPEDRRCGIDELLVVTFTDAAAGEMRSRIRAVIRQRINESPRDRYLEHQLHLLDQASISTIHSFCKMLIQRWFPQAQVDPQASVLSEDEAVLLRQEVLDALFVELYAGQDEAACAFQALVDDYGGGDDTAIAQTVLQVHDFINSLPDPRAWLEDSLRQLDPAAADGLLAGLHKRQRDRLGRELDLQIEHARHLSATIRSTWPVAAMRADELDEHTAQLREWYDALASGGDDAWEEVAARIREFEFERAAAKPRGLSEQDNAAYEAAKKLLDESKDLFKKRLQNAICRFTAEEYRDGLTRIAPYVRTLTQLVTDFDRRYRSAKSAQAALDFNDLQRCAFQLLADGGDPRRPSEVARQLQQQYRYVLVDEFQDIDPLQEAILRLVSRESADPPSGNLFAVGDIKQSIYRFRLAEPKLFSARADEFTAGSAFGELITLQHNFRSRGPLIDALNLIFNPLMSRSFGGSDYDDSARLYAGAEYPNAADGRLFDKPAVELHLLEPITEQTRRTSGDEAGDGEAGRASATLDTGDDQPDTGALRDGDTADGPEELEGIEREAFLIGRRIQQWMGDNSEGARWHVAGKPQAPGGPPTTRPIEYRDIVVLLRSLPHKAEPIADVLRRMGIPVQVGRDDRSINSTEFRDVISLLSLLDNRQQDVPMAALLRSPLLGDPLNEAELLSIRLFDRAVPFHAAVAHYAREGPDKMLRDRLTVLLAAIDRYRRQIRRTPVAEVLWDIYDQNDYLAYVAGLPDGLRRREHLLKLHELARQFGQFQRQGLRRFLRFVEEMVARDRPPQQPAAGAEENVVRIMTIHASKGLEFPVVILADLSKRFNLEDANRTVLIDRQIGIAMRAADPDRRILYPTLVHQLAAERIRLENLSEELRVLYVALTRAREHLVLVGRCDLGKVTAYRAISGPSAMPRTAPARLKLETAPCPLDWLLQAIHAAPGGAVEWHGERSGDRAPLFKIYTHDRRTTDAWRIPPAVEPARVEELARLADLEPLGPEEPVASTGHSQRIIDALAYQYEALELTTLPARVAVSELKRRWDTTFDPDEGRPARRPTEPARPAFIGMATAKDALRRGTATHRFCQCLDLARPCDADDLQRQHRELVEAGRLTPEDAGATMLDAVAWFFTTELGHRVREHAAGVEREIAFVSRIDPQRYDPLVAPRDHRDVLLIRGVIDVLIRRDHGLEIVDYKTDAIDAEACDARADQYRPQLEAYATAIQGIYQRPVTNRWLVFLHARRIVDITA